MNYLKMAYQRVLIFSLRGDSEKTIFFYEHIGTMSYLGENVLIAGNRLRRDRSCIIDYYKGHHPSGLEGNYISISGSVNKFLS
jgi:hypothetical protein